MVSKTLSAFALEGQGHSTVLYIGQKLNEGMQHIQIISPHSEIARAKYGNVSDKIKLGNFTSNLFRSCVENTGAVHISKWTTGQHHHMIGSVGEQAFNDKLGIIQLQCK